MALSELLAAASQHVDHRGRGDDLLARADLALEQEWHRWAGLALVGIVTRQQRNSPTVSGVAAYDRGDDAE